MKTIASVVCATAIALGALSGCTGSSPPTASVPPKATATSSGTGAGGQDQSSAIVGALPERTAIATTSLKADTSMGAGGKITIYGLTTAPTSTVLTFTITGGHNAIWSDLNPAFWDRFPVLVTPKARYEVVTFLDDPLSEDPWAAIMNPYFGLDQGKESAPMTLLYPPLPAGTTSVTLTGSWLADINVPVTTTS